MSLGKDNGETNARKENTKTAAERPHKMNNSHTAELVDLADHRNA